MASMSWPTLRKLSRRLLIHAQHHCPLRWVHVQAHHVHQFLLKEGIVGQLERLGLSTVAVPAPSRYGPQCPFPPHAGPPSSASTNESTHQGAGYPTCPKRSVPPPLFRSPVDGPYPGGSPPPPPHRPPQTVSSRPEPCRPSPPPAGPFPRWPHHQQPTTTPSPAAPSDTATTPTSLSVPTQHAAQPTSPTGAQQTQGTPQTLNTPTTKPTDH